VDDYFRMIETGILGTNDRVELLQGVIVDMSPLGSRHAAAVDRLSAWAWRGVGNRAIVRTQNPIRLGDSVPQPDLALAKPRDDFYVAGHPQPRDLLLVVEVAESSLDTDAEIKLPLYAAEGTVEYWIVDVADRSVTVHTQPAGDRYVNVRRCTGADAFAPAALPDLTLTVVSLFPA
jgi:Uma2 family endonuclease